MLLIDSLAEEQIQSAIRRGDFDDLPGQGRPLPPDDSSAVPEELRVAYRLLKNAGCLPPELSLRSEISQLDNLLQRVDSDSEQRELRQRLRLLKLRLALCGRESSLLIREAAYRDRVIGRLTRTTTASGEFDRAEGDSI